MLIEPKNKLNKIDNVLENLLHERGYDHKILEQQVFAAWQNAVGIPVARNSRPVSLVNGELTVYVSNSPWLTQLTFLQPKVIANINAAVRQPAVKSLRLLIKPYEQNRSEIQRSAPQQRLKVQKIPTSPEVLERIEQILVDVEEPELKACLRQLFITQSQREVLDDSATTPNERA
jgi:hypothetical protein